MIETKTHILFKYATRSRPERMFSLLDNLFSMIEDKVNYTLLLSIDSDDYITYNKDVLIRLKPYLDKYNIQLKVGKSESKIDAINRDIDRAEWWNMIVVLSDYIHICKKGFDNVIRDRAVSEIRIHETQIRNLRDKCYHYPDGFGDEITVPVMDYGFYSRYKCIFHSSYKSKFANLELKAVAKLEEKYILLEDSIFIRKHPENLYFNPDPQMRLKQLDWAQDLINFEKRKANNFPKIWK